MKIGSFRQSYHHKNRVQFFWPTLYRDKSSSLVQCDYVVLVSWIWQVLFRDVALFCD